MDSESNLSPRRRALLVGSSGGHLLQLLRAKEAFPDFELHWVCFDKPDAKYLLREENVDWCHHPTTRNIPNFLRNSVQAVRLMRRIRPDIIVSSGAAVAIPYFYLARFFGARTVFIEAFNRISSRSLTGRVVYPVADLFCVQWESTSALYKDATLIGRLP